MSNKLKALRQTFIFFVFATILAFAFVYATLWIPLEYIVYALIAGMFTYGFWIMYQVNLERLERDEKRTKND